MSAVLASKSRWGLLRVRCANLLALVSVGLCATACEKPRVEIFPSRVQVQRGGAAPVEFRVAAHLRDRKGKVLSDPITWEAVPSGIIEVPLTGDVVTVIADQTTASGTSVQLRARAGGRKAAAVVTFVEATPLSTDRAWADHVAGAHPSVAMLSGWNGRCIADSLVPFVLAGNLGEWKTATCNLTGQRATMFAENIAPRRTEPYPWEPPPPPVTHDQVDARLVGPNTPTPPNTAPPGFRTVTLKAWAFQGALSDAQARFSWDRLVAFGRFTEALAGIFFSVASPNVALISATSIQDCPDLIAFLALNPGQADAGALNVYYTPSLVWGRRGKWCGEPTSSGYDPPNLILISTAISVDNVLAHEIGHALALVEPWEWRGHADLVKGMSNDNLMWAGVDDAVAKARYRFSIGQVFRMHFDKRSWLNVGQPATDCGCDPYALRPCPKMSADVTPLADKGGRVGGGTCP